MNDETEPEEPLFFEGDPEEVEPESSLDWESVADEALDLLKEYLPIKPRWGNSPERLKSFLTDQFELVAKAEVMGDTDFLKNYARAVKLYAQSAEIAIAREGERLLADRVMFVVRLAIRLTTKL